MWRLIPAKKHNDVRIPQKEADWSSSCAADPYPKADVTGNSVTSSGTAGDAPVILIKDESGILPLSQNTRLAVIGSLSPSILHGYYEGSMLIDYFPACIGYAPGIPGKAMMHSAEELAREAECVLLLLYVKDRLNTSGGALRLSEEQAELLNSISSLARRLIVAICPERAAAFISEDTCDTLLFTDESDANGLRLVLQTISGIRCE